MSQFAKVLQVLDLFSEDRDTLAAEDIADMLAVSRPTAFRYVKQLCETGLLTKLAGRYALGAKIIALDYRIRRSEPLLQASRAPMRDLAQRTSSTVVLCSVYGDEIIHSHHEAAGAVSAMSLERGHAMPLFRSAPSAVILANLPLPRLKKLFDQHRSHPDVAAIGGDWAAFSAHYRHLRKAGYYVSHEEVDAGLIGISTPIFNDGHHVAGSVGLVFEARRRTLVNEPALVASVRACAAAITAALQDRLQPSGRSRVAVG